MLSQAVLRCGPQNVHRHRVASHELHLTDRLPSEQVQAVNDGCTSDLPSHGQRGWPGIIDDVKDRISSSSEIFSTPYQGTGWNRRDYEVAPRRLRFERQPGNTNAEAISKFKDLRGPLARARDHAGLARSQPCR